MEDMLSNIATYGYIGLFIYSLGGGFVALVAASVLSYMGKMDLATSMAIAFTANVIGDNLLFYLARNQKTAMHDYLRKHRRKLALAHLKMKQYGSWIILIQKFIYGIKTLIPIAIGLTKYDVKKFTILNILSAIVWTLVVGFASYFSGNAIVKLYDHIVEKPYIAIIVVATIFAVLWIYLSTATKKKKKK
ncbi:DedA family protein [Sulfurimonas sp. HSL-1716]|uniref:DedA family protein n=1 Tax=Hydrocurvibacter sulfurireducens TaxID=3131937 RepID=UPI0031F75D5C